MDTSTCVLYLHSSNGYETSIIVFFKRSGGRGFHDLFNQYIFPFHKRYEYSKTGAYCISVNFFRFLEPYSLDDLYEYKMSMGLDNGKNTRSAT